MTLLKNFLLSLTAKEFWKSVNIWWSYGQEFAVLFFWLTVYINLRFTLHYIYDCLVVVVVVVSCGCGRSRGSTECWEKAQCPAGANDTVTPGVTRAGMRATCIPRGRSRFSFPVDDNIAHRRRHSSLKVGLVTIPQTGTVFFNFYLESRHQQWLMNEWQAMSVVGL